MDLNLIQILEKTVAPDKVELDAAQAFLESAAQTDLPRFLVALSGILADATNSPVARVAASLQLKNHLTSKDPIIRLQHQDKWMKLEKDIRLAVKECVLRALGTEKSRPSQAAQCIAGIACAELPTDEWPELISQLVNNVTAEAQNKTPAEYDDLKEASLEAIGYICQDIEQEHIQKYSNMILTAIVQGVRKEEVNNHVKLAATNALLNSLEFTKSNFEKEVERHYIMQVTCEATQCKDNQVKVAALQCLVKIVSLYYQYMEPYMGPALFAISVEAMRSQVDEISLQGIEFWSNICDEEMDLTIEKQEAEEAGRQPEHVSRFYAKGALQYLVPILLEILKNQDENDDEDEWNPCKAAGVCLMLLANCTESDIVPHVVPFITTHISSEHWHDRDAAVMAFGSILEGPDLRSLEPLVVQAVPILITLLNDPSVVVRDTVAWTIGRICELLPQAIFNNDNLNTLLTTLQNSLAAEPRVAANVCWAFSSLAENAYEVAVTEEEDDPPTYCLSADFDNIVGKLLETTDREDAHQANLRSAAYEALMEMIKNSANDCYETVKKTTIVILQRINQILQMESRVQTPMDRLQYNDLQSLLCATLQSVLRKMKREDALKISDDVMRALLQMFNSSMGAAGGGVQEDAFVAVGTLVEVLGPEFMKYMEHFEKVLYNGLQNHEEYSVCLAAVGLVGDLCRALNAQILPMCPNIMRYLFSNLENNNVHRTIKPQILSVFGDIALAIGPEFKQFIELAMPVLKQASEAEVDKSDYDNIEYLNDLREGCLEAYTGIVQGLKGDSEKEVSADIQLIQPHVAHIVAFIEHIASDEDHTDSNVATCSGLIGDLCCAFGEAIVKLFEKPKIQVLLSEGKMSKTKKTRTLATWAIKEIRKLNNTVAQ
ncbi:Importin subunit beta-1 [Holothuria leucospilota]|uniref:Importin subunit beta-1 n=1 Tax=Holothuria leucospilota TaxID=206669 RepID=A0A9Q0YE33_HOLLE|nr:Importin subunit beta-1 [Holothuria leucospilota]